MLFRYNNSNIDIVNYFGIYLSRNGSFKTGKIHLVEKVTKAMYDVIQKRSKNDLSIIISCQLDLFGKPVKNIFQLYDFNFKTTICPEFVG